MRARRLRRLLHHASLLAIPAALACCGNDEAHVFASRAKYGSYIDQCVADSRQCSLLCELALEEDSHAQMYDTVDIQTCQITATKADGVDLYIEYTGSVECGRRPGGMCDPVQHGASAGAFVATIATFEAASVTAFARLVRQLVRLGAPAWAIAGAREAICDELVHAELAARLARALGARVQAPAIAGDDDASATANASVLEIACENMREGVVGETFGALLATCQARAARSPIVRAVFARIAHDEARHAALARRLAPWLGEQLSPRERAAVAEVEREATAALCRGRDYPLREADRVWLGIPTAPQLARAAQHLFG